MLCQKLFSRGPASAACTPLATACKTMLSAEMPFNNSLTDVFMHIHWKVCCPCNDLTFQPGKLSGLGDPLPNIHDTE